MNDLLQLTIDAHGGMKRWRELTRVSADLDVGGVLWALKGQPEFAGHSQVTVDLHRQLASHSPFLAPGHRSRVEADRVLIETEEGRVVEERSHPRESFAGHTLTTAWDRIHLAYFAGYAMWTYLTAPFSFVMDGFESFEVEPWRENGQSWRGLRVMFPSWVATHSKEQTFYFDEQGLLRRHDYDVEIAKGAKGAHYVHDYQAFDGIMVPTRRRVFAPAEDGKPMPEPLVVSVDLSRVMFR